MTRTYVRTKEREQPQTYPIRATEFLRCNVVLPEAFLPRQHHEDGLLLRVAQAFLPRPREETVTQPQAFLPRLVPPVLPLAAKVLGETFPSH